MINQKLDSQREKTESLYNLDIKRN